MIVDARVEQYGLWSVFHKHLIVELFTSLRNELGEDYWVDMESEILLVPRPLGPARPVAADVDVTRLGVPHDATAPLAAPVTPALLEVDEPIGEFEQTWIEIRRRDWPDRDDRIGSRIVGVVEVVSPSNKGLFGERDLRKFLAKRRDYLLSTVSYTEMDLLVAGQRELPSAVEKLAEHSLIAWSSQVRERSRHYWAWGWEQNQPLPTIALPLDYPHACSVDLPACYGRAYETNHWPDRLELAERQQMP
ncbi:MAG: DUF4058 family protein [Planctomycetes bacterium]|nr:DUF4058 family protein [Planctomycetota bacterium]